MAVRPVMIHHRKHRIHPAIGIVKGQIPYAFIAALCGFPEVEPYIKSVLIRKFIIIRRSIAQHIAYYLGRYGHPVSRMIVPACVHIEPVAEATSRADSELMAVVVAGREPVMPYALEETLRP